MDILLVTSSRLWFQQTDQSQELSEKRPKGPQVLHRIHNVRNVVQATACPCCDVYIRVMDTLHTILCAYSLYW